MKNIYITWHYTTHGIAYLKHILSAFYINKKTDLKQHLMNAVFDRHDASGKPPKGGTRFDEIVYLTAPQETFDKISSRRHDSGHKFRPLGRESWENIHYYTIEEQIKWMVEYSNFKNVYGSDSFKPVELRITDLRDEKQIAEKVASWAKKFFKGENEYTIDVSLGSSETQVVWYILAEKGILPAGTTFIKTYDNKLEIDQRFKSFNIKEAPTNLIKSLRVNLFEGTKSKSRELANEKMKVFLESGFSILLIGERGIGKSQLYGKDTPKINCASFEGYDDKLEVELFGVKKGTYSNVAERVGVLKKADGKKLFLDEIHHLSKDVQAKLMTAFGTDENNYMEFYRVGDFNEKNPIQVKCQLIFATNRTIEELKTILLPDFYDRIVQNVITIPSLRETPEDREQDWESVWTRMKFDKNHPVPKDHYMIDWLKGLDLYGNYRDLEKIAIYYNDFITHFTPELKKMVGEKTPFEYTKNEFEKWNSPSPEQPEDGIVIKINTHKTAKECHREFESKLFELTIKECGGDKKKAAEKLGVSLSTICHKKQGTAS